MTEGEILMRENKLDAGIAELREAIKLEDALNYDEPPGWLIPVRHSLGATLMQNGRFAEAEQVYREDLARLPDNGWSLFGLARACGRKRRTRGSRSDESEIPKTLGQSRHQNHQLLPLPASNGAEIAEYLVLSPATRAP